MLTISNYCQGLQFGACLAPPRPLTAQRGFTLIELMVAVVIVGIVLALGMPAFSVWIQNSKVRGAADSILTGIQFARTEAVKRNVPVFFQLNPDANTLWSVGCVTPVVAAPLTPECPANITTRTANEGSLLVNGALIVTIISNGGQRLVFDSFGRTTVTAPTAFGQLDIAHATLPAADNRAQRVLVGAGGTVRMCDPKLVAPNVRACP